jgi:hypothetical protein
VADSSDKARQSTDPSAPKKPYSKPRLEVYGDLRKITSTVGGHGLSDNRIFTFLRTHT